MRVLLRADAGHDQGVGHVMRCLTLAEALTSRGHSVELLAAIDSMPWLTRYIGRFSAVEVHDCSPESLDMDQIRALEPDWVVVDSYRIEASKISLLNGNVSTLAIVDGGHRTIEASLYLDQNLGAEKMPWAPNVRGRLLAGSQYGLVRDRFVNNRRDDAWNISRSRPRVVAFMGGTDPSGAVLRVADSMVRSELDVDLTLVCPPRLDSQVAALVSGRSWVTVMPPTEDLADVLGAADLVVSASGTSAWDVCTMGIPAVLVAVVENQQESLQQAIAYEVALGVDAVEYGMGAVGEVGSMVELLLTNAAARQRLAANCIRLFDGFGKFRVVEAMELASRS